MTERGPGAARVGRWLFLVSLSVYLFTAGGSLTTTDAVVSFDVARNITEHHTVAMSGNLLGMDAHRGRDGRYYSPFGLAQSLYDIPFYAAGRVARTAVGRLGKSDTVPKACVALGQTLLVALIVWEVFQLSILLVGDRQAAALAALTCAFGSLLWPYARFGFSQPLACVTLVAAIRQAIAGVRTGSARRLAGSGAWLAASLLTRHEMGLAIAPVGLWVLAAGSTAVGSRLRRLLVFSPGVIAGVAIWLIYNASRFGNPLDTGFLRDPVPAFGSPIGAGLLGLLFSPSTSLFLYSPFAALGLVGLVALVRRDRSAGLLLTVLVAGFVLFYANLGNWLGGRSYGSRYLLIVLPLLGVGFAVVLAGLAPRRRRLVFVLVAGLGVLVQLPGVMADYAKVSQAAASSRGGFSTQARQWAWAASPLVLNAEALVHLVPDNLAYVAGRRMPPAVAAPAGDQDRSFSQQFAFSLDFWWLYLFYLGVLPRAAMLALVAASIAWLGYGTHRLWQAVGAPDATAPARAMNAT